MGCDIHMFIEYKAGNNLPWQADPHHVPVWEDRCKDDSTVPQEEWCDHCKDDGEKQVYCDAGYLDYSQVRATGRDYALFGILAGVRGGGEREPLGLPDNVSDMILAASTKYGSDGHSHSYMSLEEFKQAIYEEREYEDANPPSYDAFHMNAYNEYKDRPRAYTTVINYCEKLKDTMSFDKEVFGQDIPSEVQIRLVFWFDN